MECNNLHAEISYRFFKNLAEKTYMRKIKDEKLKITMTPASVLEIQDVPQQWMRYKCTPKFIILCFQNISRENEDCRILAMCQPSTICKWVLLLLIMSKILLHEVNIIGVINSSQWCTGLPLWFKCKILFSIFNAAKEKGRSQNVIES